MDNIIYLYQRKTYKKLSLSQKVRKYKIKKIREKENWSFEENAH